MAECDICKEDREGVRMCMDCNTVFCPWCMLEDLDTRGQLMEIKPVCPKCKGNNIGEAHAS